MSTTLPPGIRLAGFSTIFWKIHGWDERRAIFNRIVEMSFVICYLSLALHISMIKESRLLGAQPQRTRVYLDSHARRGSLDHTRRKAKEKGKGNTAAVWRILCLS